ncbi:MAG: hypothetical protein HQ583_00645, partial [Candidatus Abyssubacteria bacterium]|nr:hypothetical protein [Candidatus Abyssubacteria bacterium]
GAMRGAAKGLGKMGRMTVSVNPFVPKPFTPLESAPFAGTAALSRRVNILRDALGRLGNTRLVAESPRMARLQCALARGDRRALGLIQMLAEGGTAAQAMRAFGEDIERHVCDLSRTAGMRPWHTVEPPAARRKKAEEGNLN